MGSKLAIATGLLAGILVGGLALGGAVALLPPPSPPAVPTPSPLVLASPTASPTVAPVAPSPSAPPVASPSASPSATASAQNFGIGTLAPDLKLTRVGGGTVDLLALRGKPVWVNFMATWCPECRDELPLMQGFEARYQKTGLVIVLVDVKEAPADVTAYAKSLDVTLPVALDSSGAAAAAWKAIALPMHFWLTGDGVIAAGAVGAVPADVMAADLQTILPGAKVTP